MSSDSEKSLSDDATFAGGRNQRGSSRDVSIGDERTFGEGGMSIDAPRLDDMLLDGIEIVDLAGR